jgi:hypothetical protein
VASLPPRSAHSSKYDQARAEARAILRALTGPPKKRQRIEMSRCRLCGQPSFGAYCHAHAFAYGEPLA